MRSFADRNRTKLRRNRRGRLRAALSLFLALIFSAALLPAVPAAAEAWYQDSVNKLVSWDVLKGYPDGTLQPETPITRAEFVAMVNRAYGYKDAGPTPFQDVAPGDWYAGDISVAYTAKYFFGTSATTASPNSNLTREEALVLLSRNMRLEETQGEVMEFTDGRDFSGWSRGYVQNAVRKGVVGGYEDLSFRPQNNITRGEMATMLAHALGTLVQNGGARTLGDVYGNVTISSPGTTLKDTTIAGDLYISAGLGLGSVTLDNVRVLGDIVIGGGGEAQAGDSVILRNTKSDGLVVDSLADQYVSLRAEGNTNVGDVVVRSDAFLLDRTESGSGLKNITLEDGGAFTLAGNLENVLNKSASSDLRIASGAVKTLTVDEEALASTLTIDDDAVVRALNLDTGVTVAGQGDIDALNVLAAGSATAMLPDTITIRPGLTATIAGTAMTASQAAEASADPRLLAGYPKMKSIAATTATAVFSTSKAGTVYWAVTLAADGSASEAVLLDPASSSVLVRSGNQRVTASNTEVNAALTGLTSGTGYYLSAMLVDARNSHSPVKTVYFSTTDTTVPAFTTGYPYMSLVSTDLAQAAVMTNKSCDLYYALRPGGSTTPTATEMRSGSVTGNLGYGVVAVVGNTQYDDLITANRETLKELQTYDLYLWLNDADNARSSAVQKLTFTTPDETPPKFTFEPTVTSIGATNLRLSATLNENGTVYWVAVPSSTVYPKTDGNNELSDEWVQIQIANGMNAGTSGRNGSVAVRKDTEATINITGLTAETEYNIYYIAKDTTGNYSKVTITNNTLTSNCLTASTLDNSAPTVTQEFTRYSGTDATRPYADTDIRIIFSENVKQASTGAKLLDLYEAHDTSALAAALRGTIRLYDATGTGRATLVTERTADSDTGWVIDYRNAKVSRNDKELIVAFPTTDDTDHDSALNLGSGSTYYFEIEDIADTSTASNAMGVTQLDRFTTIAAQVELGDYNLATIPDNDLSGDAAIADIAFTLTPISTKAVDDQLDWDLLIWADTSVTLTLYRQKYDSTAGTWGPWEALPRSPAITFDSTDAAGSYKGKSLFWDFDTYDTRGDNHPLNELTANYRYAVHIDKLGSYTNRGDWSGTVNFRIAVVSGSSNALRPVVRNVNQTTYNAAVSGGVDNIGVPETFSLVAVFTDSTAPVFTYADGYPYFAAEDVSVTMTLQLNRAGTVYYVVAPVGTITTRKSGATSNLAGTTGVPTVGDSEAAPYRLSMPSSSSIYNPTYSNSQIKTGSVTISGGAVTETVAGLDPETDYFVYFVMKGTGSVYSENAELYTFTTTEMHRPTLELYLTNPTVNVTSTNMNATADYLVVRYDNQLNVLLSSVFAAEATGALDTDLKTDFSTNYGANSSNTDNASGTGKKKYNELSVLEAMNESYSQGGSLFDHYASETYKALVANYIRSTTANNSSVVGSGRNLSLTRGVGEPVNCSQFPLASSAQYAFLAVGQSSAMGGSGDAFRAIYPVTLTDSHHPVITDVLAYLPVTVDSVSGTASVNNGTISLTFDEYLYWLDISTSPRTLYQVDLGPAVLSSTTRTGYRSIASLVSAQSTSSPITPTTTSGQVNKPTLTINLTVNGAMTGSYITFDRYLCDEFSNTGASALTVRVNIQKVAGTTDEYEAVVVIPTAWDGR